MGSTYRLGIDRTLRRPDATSELRELGFTELEEASDVAWGFLAQATSEISARQMKPLHALILDTARVSEASLAGADDLIVIARFGVGYDAVDVEACSRSGVLLTNAPDGSRRPMATVNIAFLLALSLKMLTKDRLTRAGRWADWPMHMGVGLTGRTLGLVGMGNIGRETLRLAAPFEMRPLVYDPFVSDEVVRASGATPGSLNDVLVESDFVCITVPLTKETRHLIGVDELRMMKPTAFLINAARGAIVDQPALTRALADSWIQGAGLDVFEDEPLRPDDPLLGLDNVILAPHALGNTDECFVLTGQSALRSVLDVSRGRIPQYAVNRDVLDSPRFQAKLRRLQGAVS